MIETIIIGMIVGMIFTGISVAILLTSAAFYVFVAVARWRVFAKAGIAGWKSLIPFYNIYLTYQIAGLPGWMAVPTIVSGFLSSYTNQLTQNEQPVPMMIMIIGFVLTIAQLYCEIHKVAGISKNFGKGTGFAVGLFFLEPIFEMILGFGDAKYTAAKKKAE